MHNMLSLLGYIFNISSTIYFYNYIDGTPITIFLNYNYLHINILVNAFPNPQDHIILPISLF